jgi:non-heme chloroperoxidase
MRAGSPNRLMHGVMLAALGLGLGAGLAGCADAAPSKPAAHQAPRAPAVDPQAVADKYFTTSDGVRLHYLQAGGNAAETIVLVPGWTMPAWIFQQQIAAFSKHYRVVAFDPRGQGDSAIAADGYNQDRRGQDIAELLAVLDGPPVVMLGWSLGVLDALAYVHTHGDARLAGLVLLDNSVGENPPPSPAPPAPRGRKPPPRLSREESMAVFVRGMFVHPQPQSYLDRLTATALRTPAFAASELLAYPVPRTYWKEAVYSVRKPVLYVVRPHFEGQAGNLAANDRMAESRVLTGIGHAMFVDDPVLFDGILQSFIQRRVWK